MDSQPGYFIIGGVTRSGTTSLHTYLADHPQVCPSSIKETRFFLDADYDLPRLHDLSANPSRYADFFSRCSEDQLRVEATPDYLFSAATAARIKAVLPQAKLLFILREPISRLTSWYHYARKDGKVAQDTSLEAYVRQQQRLLRENAPRPQHMRSLEQGRYSVYLPAFLDAFGPDKIMVARYADLTSDPLRLLREICVFAGIGPDFFDANYDFAAHNPSYAVRYPKLQAFAQNVNLRLMMALSSHPSVLNALRAFYRPAARLIFGANRRAVQPAEMPPALRAELEAYYADEPPALARLLGLESWAWQSQTLDAAPEEMPA